MTRLVQKRVLGHAYWYAVESKRVDGKPRVVWQHYLGRSEDVIAHCTEGPGAYDAVVYEFAAITALLVGRCRALGAGAGPLIFDKRNNSEENLALVARGGLHFVGSLVPSQHKDSLTVPLAAYREVNGRRWPVLPSHRSVRRHPRGRRRAAGPATAPLRARQHPPHTSQYRTGAAVPAPRPQSVPSGGAGPEDEDRYCRLTPRRSRRLAPAASVTPAPCETGASSAAAKVGSTPAANRSARRCAWTYPGRALTARTRVPRGGRRNRVTLPPTSTCAMHLGPQAPGRRLRAVHQRRDGLGLRPGPRPARARTGPPPFP